MEKIPYGRQHITDADIEAVVDALRSDFLTQGPAVGQFEKAFADYCGAAHAVAVANGTAALHLAVLALGLKPGEKVITTPITFAASANCVRYAEGEVDFCDIDPETFLFDLDKLEKKLEKAPAGTYKGVIPVSLAGYPIDGERLRKIADRHGLWVVEDACHAPGASFTDSTGAVQRTGNGRWAEATVFSFHPVKHITTGEGGAVTTNSAELYNRLLSLRSHGITRDPARLTRNDGGWYYEMQELGFNYRLTDFQAALGLSQLQHADAGVARRQAIAARYDEAFSGINGLTVPKVVAGISHAYHLYIVRTPRRKAFYDYLQANNIFAQVHYIPVHRQPYYEALGWRAGDFPVAENYYETCLSLPMYPTLTAEDQERVIETVKKFFR